MSEGGCCNSKSLQEAVDSNGRKVNCERILGEDDTVGSHLCVPEARCLGIWRMFAPPPQRLNW